MSADRMPTQKDPAFEIFSKKYAISFRETLMSLLDSDPSDKIGGFNPQLFEIKIRLGEDTKRQMKRRVDFNPDSIIDAVKIRLQSVSFMEHHMLIIVSRENLIEYLKTSNSEETGIESQYIPKIIEKILPKQS